MSTIEYKAHDGILQTTCPFKGCKIGGGECIRCENFIQKSKHNKTIKCKLKHK